MANHSNSILDSWQENAEPWIATIEKNEIKSRQLATNKAIVDAVMAEGPAQVLDLGCGEGWLTRTLCGAGIKTTGIDGAHGLIERAQQHGVGQFLTLSYDDIRNGETEKLGQFDVLVFNYAIFEKEEVASLFIKIKKHLSPNGKMVIQTISDKNELFRKRPGDGWMKEDWKGLETEYSSPFKWYFRSEKEWKDLFALTGFSVLRKKEVVLPGTEQHISVIYTVEQVN